MIKVKIWMTLQMLHENRTIEELIPVLKEYRLEQISLRPCGAAEIEETEPIHSFIFWNLIYNITKEPKKIYWTSDLQGVNTSNSMIKLKKQVL